MDALFSFASVLAVLAIFGIVAALVGEDTRDDFGEDIGLSVRFR